MNGWIDVRERLPELIHKTPHGGKSALLLAFTVRESYHKSPEEQFALVRYEEGSFIGGKGQEVSWKNWQDTGEEYSWTVLKWQPLPPPPTDIEA